VDARGSVIAERYRLVDLVGSGGMGAVWEAWDERLHRRVALKQLHPQPQRSDADADRSTKRAMREARIAARLHHPNAVPVFDVVEHEGRPCLIMQFLPSRPLSTVLREDGPLQPVDAARVGAQIASALAAAHELGIVHRDVKPGNILILDDGRAMLSDFGISHALGDDALTTTGVVHGTPAYLAPEVARGEDSSFASDVYSLGGTLYTAVEGGPPFGTDQNSMALLHRIASGDIVPPGRSGALTPDLLRMLAVDPRDRPSMLDVAGSLDRVAHPDDAHVPTASEAPTVALPAAAATPAPAAPTDLPATLSMPLPPPAPAPAPAPAPTLAPAVRSRRPRLRTVAPVVLVVTVLLGIALGVAALVNGLSGRAGDGANPAAAPSPAVTSGPKPGSATAKPTAATPAPTRSPSPSATASPSPTATASPSPTATASPSTAPPSTAAPTGPPSDAELARTVTRYYALLPADTDAGWSRLTRSYQTSRARSRQSYDRFWGGVERVSVSSVSGDAPDRVQATVTYVFDDGRTVRERTSFGLVQDGDALKIDSSTVLSSSTG
jgi:tRNA A-37 threonylcarbamoyl transferase component Bud32